MIQKIAEKLGVASKQVQAAIDLLNEGATVPFIARYRKEATQGLDDVQLRQLANDYDYYQALEARRDTIIESVREQGKLTESLEATLRSAETKQALEDLYLPYKPKRRTKAQIAIEAGLLPLAEAIMADPSQSPEALATKYLNAEAGIENAAKALEGARDILTEQWSEQPELVGRLRAHLWSQVFFQSLKVDAPPSEVAKDVEKFRDYFEYAEPIRTVPSHRALAVFRGRQLGILQVKLALVSDADDKESEQTALSVITQMIAESVGWQHRDRVADDWIAKVVQWAWRVKLQLSLERDAFSQLRTAAEEEAIKVFGGNIRDLLLSAPAGAKTVMGLDPGIRTGVKVAVVDVTGKLLDTATIYPHEPKKDWQGSLATLAKLVEQYGVQLIAIGNGTASRETDKLAADLLKMDLAVSVKPQKIMISEAGASVYSASEYASLELPDVDVSLRGAASIARRLQDPLAELVKIEPKSIGVGQYQHDVNQSALAKALGAVVEDCVNAVGVELNTASVPLLMQVSGLSQTMAKNIVSHREQAGAFANRKALLKVAGIGPKAFEQCAGFLRIRDGAEPLDATAVHPERYAIIEQLLARANVSKNQVLGNRESVKALRQAANHGNADGVGEVGNYTLSDIFNELEKPGRDPRPDFVMAKLTDGVETIADLREGMKLQGTVTNVANFGAFVDIGVHQDGLVHISQLADKFVEKPADIVKAGDIVDVTVLEVDAARKRISLSMKQNPSLDGQSMNARRDQSATENTSRRQPRKPDQSNRGISGNYQSRGHQKPTNSAMADAFAKLKK